MAKKEYRNMGHHPHDLADGKIVPAGGKVSLTDDEAKANQAAIDDGRLEEIEAVAASGKKEGGS